MKKITCFCLFLTVCLSVCGQDAEVKGKLEVSVNTLLRSINEHDYSLIEPLLDESFTLAGIRCPPTCDSARQAMRQITGKSFQYQIQQATIQQIKADGADFLVTVKFLYKEQEETKDLLLTAEGKFLDITLPGLKFMTGGQDPDEAGSPAGQTSGCGKASACGGKGKG